MKKKLSLVLSLLLVFTFVCGTLSSCGKDPSESTGDAEHTSGTAENTDAPATKLIGTWILPDSATEGTLEAYVFDADGSTFHYYQLSQTYRILNTIDGTYTVTEDGKEFTITMMGFPLTYGFTFSADGKTMTMNDHDTDTVCTRYTGELSE